MPNLEVITGTTTTKVEVSTGARGPAGPPPSTEDIVAALGVPSYASLALANTALGVGQIFWNTTSLKLEIATA